MKFEYECKDCMAAEIIEYDGPPDWRVKDVTVIRRHTCKPATVGTKYVMHLIPGQWPDDTSPIP